MKQKVLIVEDNTDIACSLQTMLNHAGYEAEITNDGDQAYYKVDAGSPNLILLDILLAGTDGQEIAKRLKSEERTKSIPILMISAHPNGARMARDSHVEGFLAKPFSAEKLLQEIESLLPERA